MYCANKDCAPAYAYSSGRVAAVARGWHFVLGWHVDHWIRPRWGISRWNVELRQRSKGSRVPGKGDGKERGAAAPIRHHKPIATKFPIAVEGVATFREFLPCTTARRWETDILFGC
jgi:hypothetical protein